MDPGQWVSLVPRTAAWKGVRAGGPEGGRPQRIKLAHDRIPR